MTVKKPSNSGGEVSPFDRTVQHDAKRTAILSQAANLFNDRGSRATTLRDIAETLGLTKTSLYYYVKTKEDLIYQCYKVALAHHHAVLDDIETTHSTPMSRASAFFLQHFDQWLAAQQGNAPHIAALLEIAALKGDHRNEIEAQYSALFKRLREYIRLGVADGSMRPCEPTLTTRAILGSVEWTFFWLHSIPADQVKSAAKQALDIIAHGLSANNTTTIPAGMRSSETTQAGLGGFNRETQNRLKQEAFFKTGTRFFNRQGFNGTSLDEIATQLNVSKGAFYYHIKNKEDLLLHCYARSLDISEKIYAQAASSAGSGMTKTQLACLQTFFVQNSSEGPLIRYHTITALPAKRRKQILQRTTKTNKRFGEFLNAGIADKSVRPINTFIAQQLIAGAINAAMDINQWRDVDHIEQAAADYFNVFFSGLLPR